MVTGMASATPRCSRPQSSSSRRTKSQQLKACLLKEAEAGGLSSSPFPHAVRFFIIYFPGISPESGHSEGRACCIPGRGAELGTWESPVKTGGMTDAEARKTRV